MKAVIVHEVRILDPRTIEGYAAAAARYMQANSSRIHDGDLSYRISSGPFTDYYGPDLLVGGEPKQLFLPEGQNQQNPFDPQDLISLEQFDRVKSGAELGSLFYPPAFSLLERIGVKKIYHLKDQSSDQVIRGVIYTLHNLREFIELELHSRISFNAEINLPMPLGIYRVKVRIDPFIAVYAATDENPAKFNSKNLMAIDITARFTSPDSAISGLRGLAPIFPDFAFEEKLLVGNLPRHIAEMYKEIEAFIGAYWEYEYDLTSKKPDLDEAKYREMTLLAGMAHIELLKPIFEGLGIHPHRVDYHDNRSNMDYRTGIENLDEVIWQMSRGYYDGSRIPTIHATFNGQKIVIEFTSWESRLGSNFAMQVRDSSGNHTLESMLAGIKSSFPGK